MARTLQDLLTIPTPQIVVRQHHDRRADQVGAKNPLTTAVEAVAVNQRDNLLSHNFVPVGTGRCRRPKCAVPRPQVHNAVGRPGWPSATPPAAARCRKS